MDLFVAKTLYDVYKAKDDAKSEQVKEGFSSKSAVLPTLLIVTILLSVCAVVMFATCAETKDLKMAEKVYYGFWAGIFSLSYIIRRTIKGTCKILLQPRFYGRW
jgi:short subunit fatty acids transporter